MVDVKIEKVRPDNRCLADMAAVYQRAYKGLEKYAFKHKKSISGYLKWLRKRTPEGFIVARAGDRLVGFVVVDPSWLTYDGQVVGEIHELAVDPEFQGQGLGKGLLLSGLELLRSRGTVQYELWVGEENYHAQSLYLHLGFEKKAKWYHWVRMIKTDKPAG